METKILFTDLDGTLLTSERNISPDVLAAIEELIEKGHKFVLSTGRPLMSALQLAKTYDFIRPGFYISSFNGGLIYDCYEEKELHRKGIPHAAVRLIFDEAKKRGLHVHTYSDTHVLAEKPSEMLTHYCQCIGMPYRIVPSVTDELPFEPQKVIVADLADHSVLEAFRNDMRPIAEPSLNSVFSNPMLLEYGNPTSTKGNALRFLCELYGIDMKNSVAAGDEENDLTMIEAAGIGVAMANAKEEVKNAASYITQRDNNHGGIKEIIEKFFL